MKNWVPTPSCVVTEVIESPAPLWCNDQCSLIHDYGDDDDDGGNDDVDGDNADDFKSLATNYGQNWAWNCELTIIAEQITDVGVFGN